MQKKIVLFKTECWGEGEAEKKRGGEAEAEEGRGGEGEEEQQQEQN